MVDNSPLAGGYPLNLEPTDELVWCAICNCGEASYLLHGLLVCQACTLNDKLWKRSPGGHPDRTLLPFIRFHGDGKLIGLPFILLDEQPQFHRLIADVICQAEQVFDHIPMCSRMTIVNLSQTDDPLSIVLKSAEQQLPCLHDWANRISDSFARNLSIENNYSLLSIGWIRILLLNVAFNSVIVENGLVLASGYCLIRSRDPLNGLGTLLNKVYKRLVIPYRALALDSVERGMLRAVVLYNTSLSNDQDNIRLQYVRSDIQSELRAYQHDVLKDIKRTRLVIKPLVHLLDIAEECKQFLQTDGLQAMHIDTPLLARLVEHGRWPVELD